MESHGHVCHLLQNIIFNSVIICCDVLTYSSFYSCCSSVLKPHYGSAIVSSLFVRVFHRNFIFSDNIHNCVNDITLEVIKKNLVSDLLTYRPLWFIPTFSIYLVTPEVNLVILEKCMCTKYDQEVDRRKDTLGYKHLSTPTYVRAIHFQVCCETNILRKLNLQIM